MSHHRHGLVCCDVVWTGNKILICGSGELNREEDSTDSTEVLPLIILLFNCHFSVSPVEIQNWLLSQVSVTGLYSSESISYFNNIQGKTCRSKEWVYNLRVCELPVHPQHRTGTENGWWKASLLLTLFLRNSLHCFTSVPEHLTKLDDVSHIWAIKKHLWRKVPFHMFCNIPMYKCLPKFHGQRVKNISAK